MLFITLISRIMNPNTSRSPCDSNPNKTYKALLVSRRWATPTSTCDSNPKILFKALVSRWRTRPCNSNKLNNKPPVKALVSRRLRLVLVSPASNMNRTLQGLITHDSMSFFTKRLNRRRLTQDPSSISLQRFRPPSMMGVMITRCQIWGRQK